MKNIGKSIRCVRTRERTQGFMQPGLQNLVFSYGFLHFEYVFLGFSLSFLTFPSFPKFWVIGPGVLDIVAPAVALAGGP